MGSDGANDNSTSVGVVHGNNQNIMNVLAQINLIFFYLFWAYIHSAIMVGKYLLILTASSRKHVVLFFASSKGLIKHDIHSSETSMNFCDNMKEPRNMTWHDTLLTQHHSRSFRHQSSHYGMPVICRVPSHTAKDVIHMTNSSRHRTTGKAPLCRESFHRHSAKSLPWMKPTLGKHFCKI